VEFHVILWPIQTKEYLLVLPPERWQLLLERLKGNSINNRGLAAYEREIARSSAVLELDKVGRFCLPENLAEQAGINGEAFFVGRLNKFEIWNPKRAKAAAAADVALVNEIAGSIEL
jgi:DNA-binding transcriptional regulator/RsmH inhibitor MraZ